MTHEASQIIFGLLGGLSVFIYAMNLMGDGLQKIAGERMRKVLEVLTYNPFVAILVGALVTAVLQSSTATTVLVIGFVGANLMNLKQAIGVIMGANIGTTITAQLIAFKLGNYIFLIAAIGFIFFFFFKKKSFKYFGQSVFAFGLLFIGLEIMSGVLKPLANSPLFVRWITEIGQVPIYGVLVGTVMTAIVQSSTATIAVLQNLASAPAPDGGILIELRAAIPILLGDNIGTTITATLAAIGAKTNAKRAAFAHTVFNVMGILIFIWFIPSFARFVEWISPKGSPFDIIPRQIANAHTSFNVFNTLIWIPFIWLIAKIVTLLVKDKDEPLDDSTLYLDNRVLGTPSMAMDLVTKELTRMAEMGQEMMSVAKEAFIQGDIKKIQRVNQLEDWVDYLQVEITKYLSKMLSNGTLTEPQGDRLAGLMHITHDIERIGDHCQNIAEFAQTKEERNFSFSKEAILEITKAFTLLNTMVDNTINALKERDTYLANHVLSKEYEVDKLEIELRAKHIDRLNHGSCNHEAGIIYIELIHNIERIADHCNNIAEAVIQDVHSKSAVF
jgi:phosphate:Na+ symporter